MKIPKKLNIANVPTPLETVSFEDNKLLLKRDDLTGSELSGNKIRKLEYLIYQAKKEKAEIIFTEGGEQSNHARATVIAARKYGINTKLFLWGKDSTKPDGNLFMDKFLGADITFLNKSEYANVNDIMFDERKKLEKKNKKVYVIPGGGSTTLGIWGYVNFIDELQTQCDLKKIRGIVSACGSGGTAAGLLVGASLRNLNLKIYAVNVLHSKEAIKKKILNLAEGCKLDYNLDCEIQANNLQVLDGYSNEGYKNIDQDKLKLIKKFAYSSGIIFDPAYTGKAFKAYYDNFLTKNLGMKYIFIHTGGFFGIFSKRGKYLAV